MSTPVQLVRELKMVKDAEDCLNDLHGQGKAPSCHNQSTPEQHERAGPMNTAVKALIHHTLRALAAAFLAVETVFRPLTRARPENAASLLVLEYVLPLGNCVHMTPVFEAIKRTYPDKTLTVATRGLGLQVLRHSPFIDHLIETPDPLTNFDAAAHVLRAELSRRGIALDACLTGIADRRTRLALLAARVCRGWRGGYTLLPALYRFPLRNDVTRSLLANNLRLAELVGATGPAPEPKIFYTARDADSARAWLAPLRASGKPILIAVSQHSGGQPKDWHEDRWLTTLRFARNTLGYALVFVGIAPDAPGIERLRNQLDGETLSLAGKTSIAELTAVLAAGDLMLTLDTGTMHVGRCAGIPMVILGPSWQPQLEWMPLGLPRAIILQGPDRPVPPPGYKLDEIAAEDVIHALTQLSEKFPPSESERERRLQAGLSIVDLLA